MKQQDNRQPFETWMRAYVATNSQMSAAGIDKESELVFSKQFDPVLPFAKAQSLLSALEKHLSEPTLGSLVHSAMSKAGKSAAQVQNATGLPPSLLEDIREDSTFPNSIPVRSLVKMLHLLQITLEDALAAINTTYERLRDETRMMEAVPAEIRPVFRRNMPSHVNDPESIRFISDAGYLYKNRKALDKFTARLCELYQEMS